MPVHLLVKRVEVLDHVEGHGVFDVLVFDARRRAHIRGEIVTVMIAVNRVVVLLDFLGIDLSAVLFDDPLSNCMYVGWFLRMKSIVF